MILPSGSRDVSAPQGLTAAYSSVRPPTLPKNISPISTQRDTGPSDGVMPMDSPTVPMAETVSKMHGSKGSPSAALITKAPASARKRYSVSSVEALLTVSSSIRRLNSRGLFRRRTTAAALAASTAAVVVFTPPAVEPGFPPMNIKRHSSRNPPPESF